MTQPDRMEVYSALSDSLARISSAWSAPQLWSSVKDFAVRFGYTHVYAVDAARLVGGACNAVIYSDAPRALLEEIDREMTYAQHPVVDRALRSPTPFVVSEMRKRPEYAGQRWTDLFADVIKNGEGLVVPVYRGSEPIAGINFGGQSPDTSAIARSMLQVVAHAAIDRVGDIGAGKSRPAAPSLSVREAQCLRWVAIGRADAEIGQILGISPRTVRFHVDSAKLKLGVSTRIQAVAKALREKIIAV